MKSKKSSTDWRLDIIRRRAKQIRWPRGHVPDAYEQHLHEGIEEFRLLLEKKYIDDNVLDSEDYIE